MQRTKGNNLDSDKILLSVKEASELTGISERKLRDLMKKVTLRSNWQAYYDPSKKIRTMD